MKKLFKALLSLVMVLGLVSVAAACDKEQTPEPTKEETKVETQQPTKEETKVETPVPTQPVETPVPTQPVETPVPTQPVETPTPTEPAPVDTNISYHVVGGYLNDWNNYTDDNKMTSITVEELNEISAEVAAQLADKEIEALVKFEGRTFNAGAGWTANAVVDGEPAVLDGGYTIKVVRAKYDAEDEVMFADQWNPDPKTSCVANYTPDTLFMPKWVETPADGEESLGTWADNPVVIGGAGEYTVIFVQYKGANTADSPKYGMALIQTKELEEPKTMGQKIQEEYDALKADETTEHTEFEFTAPIVALETKWSDKHSNYTVNLIVDVDGVLVGIYSGQLWDAENEAKVYPATEEQLVGLEVGKKVTVKGTIAEDYTLAVGDYNVDIEFSKPIISWEVETYTKVTVAGIPAEATAVNAYWWGSADAVEWPGRAMTKNEDGTYSLDFPDHATGLIFNWTVGEASSQTVDLTPDKENTCWTLGAAGEDGKYPATNAKCYYDAITVDAAALIADLSDSLVEGVTEVPAEYDVYVWFWGGSATGWFEAVNADGTFNVAAGCNGCTFLMAEKGATPAWETKLAQTGDYVIASGVATPKPAAE